MALALLAALVLLGCPNDDNDVVEPSPDDESFEVTAQAVAIAPFIGVPDEIPEGPSTFRLVNADQTESHAFRIEELDEGTDVIAPGQMDEFTVELEPGSYTYFCSVPGHRPAGMEGTFEVTDG